MPTYSESRWSDLSERYERARSDFKNKTDSEDVFRARLYGLGYRGRAIANEVWLAKEELYRAAHNQAPPATAHPKPGRL